MSQFGRRAATAVAACILQTGCVALGRLRYLWKWTWILLGGSAALWLAAWLQRKLEEKLSSEEKGKFRQLAREERRIWLIWFGLLANALVLGAGFGSWIKNASVSVIFAIAAGMLLTEPLMCFLICWPSSAQLCSRKNELNAQDFPLIHALLGEEMENKHRRIRIFLGDGGASAFIAPAYDGILISPLLLAVLTRAELRQVFRHELAHLSSRSVRREMRWRRLETRMMYACECWGYEFRRFTVLPLSAAVEGFSVRLKSYLNQVEPQREREADLHAMSRSEAQHTAAAIAKAEFVDRFLFQNDDLPRCMEKIVLAYSKAVAQNGMAWLEELERMPKDEDDPHPGFHERRMYLGVTQPDPYEKETDEAWLREMGRMYELTDKMMNPR